MTHKQGGRPTTFSTVSWFPRSSDSQSFSYFTVPPRAHLSADGEPAVLLFDSMHRCAGTAASRDQGHRHDHSAQGAPGGAFKGRLPDVDTLFVSLWSDAGAFARTVDLWIDRNFPAETGVFAQYPVRVYSYSFNVVRQIVEHDAFMILRGAIFSFNFSCPSSCAASATRLASGDDRQRQAQDPRHRGHPA